MCPKMTPTKSGMRSHIAQMHSFVQLTTPEPQERSDDEGGAAKRPKTERPGLTVIEAHLETKPAPSELREAARRRKVALLEDTAPSDLLMRSRVQCAQCPQVAPMWQCLACRRQFADRMSLDEHVRMTHVEGGSRGDGPLKLRMLGHCCAVCGRCFDELEYMVGHHVAMHPEAPPPALEYLRRSTDWALLCFGCLLYYRRTGAWFERHRCVNRPDVEALQRTKALVERPPRYLCDVCAATFRFKCAYQYHRLARHKGVTEVDWAQLRPTEIPFVCERCERGFTCDADLRAHRCAAADEAAPAKPKVRCPHCAAELSTVKVLRRHVKMMHSAPAPARRRNGRPSLRPEAPTIKCPFCAVMFTTTRDTLRHVEAVHNARLSSAYYCATCARDFSSNAKLRQHCATYHSGPEDAQTVRAACADAERRRGDTVYYLCRLCARKFLQPMDYFRHHQWHLAKREFTCDRCGHGASTREALRTHLRSAHAEPAAQRRFECDQCDSALCSRFSLREHRAAVHGAGERAYVCERCGKDFPTKVRLQTHLRNHLFGSQLSGSARRYGCDLCGKDFKKKQTLRDHLAVHSGVRNEACPQCGKRFFTKLAAYFHRLNAHTESRPHKCHLCEASFPLPSFLTRHLKKHAEREARAARQAGEAAAAGSKAGRAQSRGKRAERGRGSSAEDGVEDEVKEEELVLEDGIGEEVLVEEVTCSETE